MRSISSLTPVLPAAALSLLAGCGAEDGIAPLGPAVAEPVQVVPFSAPPEGVVTQQANNNLDVVVHEGRYFLAFRTAPNHFASDKAEIYVVSSDDQERWTLEARIARGTDLREPRLLSHGGALVLYFAVLGEDPTKFEPQGTMFAVREAPGRFSEPVWWTEEPGFIPWRLKVIDGVAYMIGYAGGENIYEVDGEPIQVKWLKSRDGLAWEPVVPGQPTVQRGGGSETDFVFQDDGSVVAVTRNEAGDELGWGSKICRADPGRLGEWKCAGDKRKFDSPLVFRRGADIYLIGRRNLTETGNFDLDLDELPPRQQAEKYLVDYSFERKRCALWKVDPDALAVSFVLDLPSRGDTCFASALDDGERGVTVYNYTSPLDGEDQDWILAQGGPTIIYRATLHLP
ncbi:uncharacterized protein SOCE26_051660 [Sorangium cellulosum]|uniref:Secreted protein n=1 Tax=Sorangium cellulosum TaxID=56 RepID=A0A2L0EWN2_SORCE|nr:hypothetical protein [Sorangium cellulosum]AUX43713.1 uncharacterized protein SOCE26_051660 [Sorangium cellulosum]